MIGEGATREMAAATLAAGYRHIDTAGAYGNEAQVGEAVREFGEKVYVTTKYFTRASNMATQMRLRRSAQASTGAAWTTSTSISSTGQCVRERASSSPGGR